MTGRVVTEADIRAAAGAARSIALAKGAVVTPAARDLAKKLGVALVKADGRTGGRADEKPASTAGRPAARPPVVALGADHGGFPMKEALKQVLADLGCEVLDLGTHSTAAVDYPDLAIAVARAVAGGKAWRGIVVDGAGIGSCMAANKVPGVRAAQAHDAYSAERARKSNDAQILALGARVIGPELAKTIVRTWLRAEFAGGGSTRKVAKIKAVDEALRQPAGPAR